jgi:hypothetical protein
MQCCRRLQSLCILVQSSVPIDLHALAVIAPQLHSLTLQECSLSCRDDFSFFDSAFANLEKLDITRSTLHARLGMVNLPSLTDLSMQGFTAQLDLPCIDAFAGCPQCTCLGFSPIWHRDGLNYTASCMTFAMLGRVQVHFCPLGPWDRREWPAPLPELDLPGSVTSLTCKGVFNMSGGEKERPLDLFAALSIAARSIEAGVPLSELCCEECATYAIYGVDDDGHDANQGLGDHEVLVNPSYRPLCLRLHGLTRLDLSKSPRCHQGAVDDVVKAAPDLIDLEVLLDWAVGQMLGRCSGEVMYSYMHCIDLRELTVQYRVGSHRSSEPLVLDLDLQFSYSLDAFFIQGLQEELMSQDKIDVQFEVRAGANVEADAVCKADGEWTLQCFITNKHDEAGPRQEWVTFVAGPDLVWSASVWGDGPDSE